MKSLYSTLLIFFVAVCPAFAQDEDALKISGFLDTYYSYDFSRPSDHVRPQFLYNYTRHNEINVNLALLKAAYATDNVRANLALMAGTYPQYNLAAEQNWIQNIYEANAGVKLSETFWVDAGIMSSHIGWESAISKDNPTLTRSLAAENSPYYLSAVKLSFSASPAWSGALLVMNGWQRVARVDNNSTPAVGSQLTFKPRENITFNYSTFFGNDKPDSARAWRFFNDLYATCQLSPSFNIIAGFDYGFEQSSKGSSKYRTWYTWAAIAKYQLSEKLAFAGRIEQYVDKNGVIVASGTPHGFQTLGLSINGDIGLNERALLRTEIRSLSSRDKIFDGMSRKTNLSWTSSLSVAF